MEVLAHEWRQTLLKVSGVSVSYGGQAVLRNVDLEVKNVVRPGLEQGQVVGLLGPSGVGKTTLFRVLAGLSRPDSGTVLINDELKPVERGMVGVVAQNYPLFAHRTVMGNLLVAGAQAGLKGAAAREKASSLLERFGLGGSGGKYPSQLSGGQRQRAAIAQQFMCSESFLLMDEPFSGLDLMAQGEVIRFIQEMARQDELATFIIVTHDISAAIEVCDTLWLLGRDRGEDGKPIPGARVQASYDLIGRGLAWRQDITQSPEFLAQLQEIRAVFPRL